MHPLVEQALVNNFCSCSFYWVIFVLQGTYPSLQWPQRKACVPETTLDQQGHPGRLPSVLFLMGRRWVLKGTRNSYCSCLMGWKSQKGKRKDGRQNAVGIIFISKIAKLNFSLGFWQMCRAASTFHTDVSEFQEVLSPKWWLQHSIVLASI